MKSNTDLLIDNGETLITAISPPKKSVIHIAFFGIAIICIVSISIIALLWIVSDIRENRQQIQYEIDKEKQIQKQILKEQVMEVTQYIYYMKSRTDDRLETSIKQRSLEAYDIVNNLYSQYKNILPAEKIQLIIKDALRPVRFNNDRGYYFIISMDGTGILISDRPELEGRNILDIKDNTGRYAVRGAINLAKEKNEGFYEYCWTKPGKGEEKAYNKISYIKHFAPYDWYIGTGEYIEDVEQDIQKEAIKRIENIKFSETGYVFAGTLDGLALSGPAKGKNMIAVTDINGIKIVQELVKAAKSSGGYVEYQLPPFEGYRQHRKISYTMSVPEWNWYVGAGLDVKSFNQLEKQKEIQLKEQIKEHITNILFLLILVIFTTVIIISIISKRIRRNFQVFETFFQNASSKKEKIDTSKIHFSEFHSLASSANQMIEQIKESERMIMENQKMLVHAEKMTSMGGLAAGMAHEINNPLGIIMGAVQNTERRLDPEFKQNIETATELGVDFEKLRLYLEKRSIFIYLDNIRHASERAASIVKNMLGFSRRGESKDSLENISALLDNAIDLALTDYDLKKRYDFKSVEIIREYEPDISIICNATEILQVVLNILKNAAQALFEEKRVAFEENKLNRKSSRITISTRTIDYYCIIKINDNGPGMDDKTCRRIFEPFFTTKPTGMGTGLGLSVSYYIITQSHGGQIKVDSIQGEGTTFTIHLPVQKPDDCQKPGTIRQSDSVRKSDTVQTPSTSQKDDTNKENKG